MLPESSSPHGEAQIGASADANGGVQNKAKANANANASSADAAYLQASAITSLRLDVLLSVGRHRLTGRAQRADGDARALEMALSLKQALSLREALVAEKTTPPEVELIPWHQGPEGDDTEAALRGYLGMGLDAIRWIKAPAAADAMAPLRASLASPSAGDAHHRQARLVLCGMRAEQGEGTGMLPMVLAEQLGCDAHGNSLGVFPQMLLADWASYAVDVFWAVAERLETRAKPRPLGVRSDQPRELETVA